MKTALITGINGQAGTVMAEYLLKKEYHVVGLIRRSSTDTKWRLKENVLGQENFTLVEGDICDSGSINCNIIKYKPNELYHYAAQSHVHTSFEQPYYTNYVNVCGTLNILESVRMFSPKTKIYNSSSSEMFGSNYTIKNLKKSNKYDTDDLLKIQDEETPFHPRSPYAASKVAAHYLCQNYRESYGLYISSGITFNFESKYRGEEFVTRKITKWIADNYSILSSPTTQSIYLQKGVKLPKLKLGNINAFRDWSNCKDTVRAQHLMLQQDKAEDYVVASERTHSIKDFLKLAFGVIGIKDWASWIEIDPAFYRPSEVEYLRGDASKIKKLGWKPECSLEDLVHEMVKYDLGLTGYEIP